jgi:putative transposase
MKESYLASELGLILGISVQAVHKRSNKESWRYVETPNGKGGGLRRRYLTKSFSKGFLEKLTTALLKQKLNDVRECRPSQDASESKAVVVRETREVILPERAKQVGLAKHELVMAWREAVKYGPWGGRAEASEAFLAAYNSGGLLPGVFKIVGQVTTPTLYRLNQKLVDSGGDFHAISDGRGGWRKHGTNLGRPRKLSRDAEESLLRCYLQPNRPTVDLAIRAARMILKKNGILEECCNATMRRFLDSYAKRNQHIVVMARDGFKAYQDKVGPYVSRDASILEVGQVLVADGHTLNFTVLHPRTGKPVRMKLILFFDWASRYPVGWQIMPTENTVAIQAALRMAIQNLGKYPQILYIDNGKAFKAKVFTDTDPDFEELQGLFARLGMAVMFAMPYRGRSKVVERFFSTVNMQCEEIMPAYCGRSIDKKPAWMHRNEQFHKAWHEARTGGWVPNVREAAHFLEVYFRWYAEQPHAGLGGRTPGEIFSKGVGPGVDVSELNYHFLWRERRTPRNCRITLFGIDYEADCLHGMGEDVMAAYDTANLNTVYCYTLNGEYLGDACPVEALHPVARILGDEVSVDQVKDAMRRQRHLYNQTKQGLIELGARDEDVQGLKALPWNQRLEVLPGGKQSTNAHEDPSIPQGERRNTNKEKKVVYLPLDATMKQRILEEIEEQEEMMRQARAEDERRRALENEDDGFVPTVDRQPSEWERIEAMEDDLDRYEELMKLQVQGFFIPKNFQSFMRYLEETPTYKRLQSYFEDRRAQFVYLYGRTPKGKDFGEQPDGSGE